MTYGKRRLWWIAPCLLLVIPLAAPAQPPYQTQNPIAASELRQLLTEQETNAQVIEGDLFLTYSVQDRTIPALLLVDEMLQRERKWTARPEPAHLKFEIKNCIIDGDLDLSRKKISFSVTFNNVRFNGKVNFFRATVQGVILVTGNCHFQQEVTFNEAKISDLHISQATSGTIFEGNVWSLMTSFGAARFDQVIFRKSAGFEGAKFANDASFRNASFASDANFKDAVFSGYATFRSATIGGPALFRGVAFGKESYFTNARFNGEAVFAGVHFTERADFAGVQFTKADFSDAVFHGVASFNHANFSQLAWFEFTRFDDEADFEDCSFPDKRPAAHPLGGRGLYFSETRFEKRTRLTFEQLVSGTYRIPFSNPDTKVLESYQPSNDIRVWEALSQTFEKSGELSSHNEAEYQKQLAYARLPGTSRINAARNSFWRLLWGYGYRPWRTLFWLFALLALFAGIYWSQPKQLKDPKPHWPWIRWKSSWLLSWRAAFKLKPVIESARTRLFKVIIFTQWVLSKLLLLLFLKALAKNTPLVGELLDKLIPL